MKIIGMVSVFNNENIIEEIITHLIHQGIELVILDNASTDKSFNICEKYLGKGVLEIFSYKTKLFKKELILLMLYHMALRHSPDWLIVNDSDEILESDNVEFTLKEAIEKVDSESYNTIQFARFDFFMTDNDDLTKETIREKLTYYSYQGDYVYRAWKYFPGINSGDVAGHFPIYPEGYKYKIYPKKFILRHYPFQSEEQAKKKMIDRTKGFTKEKHGRPLNEHYEIVLGENFSKRISYKLVNKYSEDGKWIHVIQYAPFETPNPKKREELFSKEGELINKQLTVYELKLQLKELRRVFNKINTFKGSLRHFANKTLEIISKD